MSTELISLEIEGFRSFKDRQVINFPTGDATVLISGKYKGSEVRSGTGKTSILEALAVCFDISSSSLSSAKCWYAKKMFLKCTLKSNGDIIEVTRDPKLSLSINGKPYESLVKGAKEKLQEILGVNSEILKVITYRKQRVRGIIVNSTDSKIKEFLTQPLGLHEIENAADKFTQEFNKKTAVVELLKRDIANYEYNLPMNFVSDDDIAQSKIMYDAAVSQANSLKINDNRLQLNGEIQLFKTELSKMNSVNFEVSSKRRDNASIKESIMRLRSEADRLTKNMCPTCSREWNESQEMLQQKTVQIENLIMHLQTNVDYIKNAEPLISNIPNLESKLQELNQKLGEASAPLNMAESALYSSKSALNSLLARKSNYDKINMDLIAAKNKNASESIELEVLAMSTKMLGRAGFLGSIFDEILSDIEYRTNDMLSHFPNANHITVHINSDKAVKSKGTTKKEISISLSTNGIDMAVDDVSGGQQSAIELCSDLATGEAIKARSGCSLMWNCLDEVLDGLGAAEKEAVVSLIKHRIKGLVLMIEHATEIRESFDQVIEVEYDGKESNVITR